MSQLPQATKDRIEKEAKSEYQMFQANDPSVKHSILFQRIAYANGATAEALRAQPLLEALEKISAVMEKPTIYDPGQEIYQMCEIAAEALLKYNSK